MTILVVFGIPDSFGVEHGYSVASEGERHRVFFAQDKSYECTENEGTLILPRATDRTLLPVLQHKGSSEAARESQLAWLRMNANYDPVKVDLFSHYGEEFAELKGVFQGNKPAIPALTERYRGRVALDLLDILASWHALNVGDPKAYDANVRTCLEGLHQFLGNEDPLFGDCDDQKFEEHLKSAAARFC